MLIMKKFFFTCAIAAAALAVSLNNFAGAAHKNGADANMYAANDTIPKKDTTKKDTPSFAFNALDTIPKKDTVKKDTTPAYAYAFNALDTIPKKDTVKKDTTPAYAFVYNRLDTIPKKDTVKKDTTAFALLAKN